MTNNTTVMGRNGIKATVIADSISAVTSDRMTTMEIEYPRFILAELNTHKMLSKNSASSRAIPTEAMHQHILEHMAMPVEWGRNKSGMQAAEELSPEDIAMAKEIWASAIKSGIQYSKALADLGLHKQIVNRLTEAGMVMKTVISGTEWNNLYHLRAHADAQPEFAELAFAMLEAHTKSDPFLLYPGEWHLPYINRSRNSNGSIVYGCGDQYYGMQNARIISASCCAQVSYRKNNEKLEVAQRIFDKLINTQPCHASPVEHQATPMAKRTLMQRALGRQFTEPGITHVDRNGNRWSANLQGFIQFRKLIPGDAVWGRI